MVAGFVTAFWWLKFAGGLSGAAKRESYCEVLDSSFKELSALGPVKIDAIMEFYTFLRGARDATLSFNNWVNNDGENRESYHDVFRKADDVHVAYLLFASLESAQKACIAFMAMYEGSQV